MEKLLFLLLPFLVIGKTLSAPGDTGFVVSSSEPPNVGKEGKTSDNLPQHPEIYEMDITSNISNRFAKTLVVSKVKNKENVAKETTFTVVLPEQAFISEFVMEIGGKSYKAYVKEKEEAKKIYNQAVASGQSAGHVAVSTRDSNKFTVSVNIEPESKVVFLLTYEELLERRNDQYELIVNINPGQIVKDLNVKVQINETRPLKFVRTPSLRSGNEISKNDDKLNPSSDIQVINSTTALVKFNPDSEDQKQFARHLGNKESDGLAGQFVVQYDVARDPYGGEVLLQDGYFVHFFAPSDLEPLPKHVLLVLDSSGSMDGRKIEQVKDAVESILNELREQDIISIIDFGNEVSVWDIAQEKRTSLKFEYKFNYEQPFDKLSKELPSASTVNKQTLTRAKQIMDGLRAWGGTNIIGGLEAALYLAKMEHDHSSDKKYQPVIIFLTDGEPNVGVYSTESITNIVTRLNAENNNIPIFSLSFGEGADKEFLKKLSLKNQGFSRHIYEAADASLQIQEFYKQVSSPLLSNITFKYNAEVKEVTKTTFPIYFRGSEIIVTGKYDELSPNLSIAEPISCFAIGPKVLQPTVERPVTSLERLWAYLTVKQLLDERELADNKTELTKKALDLALKYSFVTDITSLVVVKPNETTRVNTEDAYNERDNLVGRNFGLSLPVAQRQFYSSPTVSASASYRSGIRPFSLGGPGLPGQSGSAIQPFSLGGPGLPGQSGPAIRPFSLGGPDLPGQSGSAIQPFSLGGPDLPGQSGSAIRPFSLGGPGLHGQSGSAIRPFSLGGPGLAGQSGSAIQPFSLGGPGLPGQSGNAPPAWIPYGQHYAPYRPLTTTVATTTLPGQKLVDMLPWLASNLNPNGTLTVGQDVYELGEFSYPVVIIEKPCPQTPLNATQSGSCSILPLCPDVYSHLTDFSVYQQYFCSIEATDKKYAGVCCPLKSQKIKIL